VRSRYAAEKRHYEMIFYFHF